MMRHGRQQVEAAFVGLGLRASVQPLGFPAYAETDDLVRVRLAEDGGGAFFDVRYQPQLPVEFTVTGVQPALHRLVLTASDGVATLRFLCGRRGARLFIEPLRPAEAVAEPV